MPENRLSNTLNAVQPSATMAISGKARDMIAAGLDVLLLSQGEPDFDTPEHIRLAAIDALASGKTRYTNVDGITELKDAIIQKFKRDNELSYSREQISVAPGGKAILFNALLATLNPGDEVIIPAPCWVSYPEMVRLCGGTPIILATDETTGFKVTPEQLARTINSRTRWLILNSPSNPTGSVLTADELSALAAVLKDHPQVMILTDDIYEHLVFGDQNFSTIGQIAPDLYDRTLTMNGVSKAYAMTGWRIGYAGGPKWLISAMRKIMGQSTSNPSSVSQWAAVAALNGSQAFLPEWRAIFQSRRDLICQGLQSAGLKNIVPDGAFYVFADCRGFMGKVSGGGKPIHSDKDFAEALLVEAMVAVVPGSAFHGPGYFRLSFAESEDVLEEAIKRINRFCQECR